MHILLVILKQKTAIHEVDVVTMNFQMESPPKSHTLPKPSVQTFVDEKHANPSSQVIKFCQLAFKNIKRHSEMAIYIIPNYTLVREDLRK